MFTETGPAAHWQEAAGLLRRAGGAPRSLRDWLGPGWSGPAARAFELWAEGFEAAALRMSAALGDAADAARVPAADLSGGGRRARSLLDAELANLDRALRGLDAVRVPGGRSAPAVRPAPHRSGRKALHRGVPHGAAPHGAATRRADRRAAHRDRRPEPGAAAAGRARGSPAHASNPRPADRVDGWIAEATAVLRAHGYPAAALDPADIATIIRYESAGNPRAVNNWDHNAAHGNSSMGLMQTVPGTFERYRLPGHHNILNPVDNIIAGVRYAVARYGSVSLVPGILSLARGRGYRGY